MIHCEKPLEIIQCTHDGNDLAPAHLKLVELATDQKISFTNYCNALENI